MPSFKTTTKLCLQLLILFAILSLHHAFPTKTSLRKASSAEPSSIDNSADSSNLEGTEDEITQDEGDKLVVSFDFVPAPTSDPDLQFRDKICQRYLRTSSKNGDSWGPLAPVFAQPEVPNGENRVQWMRERVVTVAKRYIGLPYQHHHIPTWTSVKDGLGVDCSNFSAWVYNFALGIKMTGDVQLQADSDKAMGRKIKKGEKLEVGDLLFIEKADRSYVSHVVIYIGDGKIIDSRGKGGVQIRDYAGWSKSHHVFTRRLIE